MDASLIVTKLVRHNRLLMIVNGTLVLALVGCLAFLLKSNEPPPVQDQRVETHDLIITDGQGNRRAQLLGTESGAILTMYDSRGKANLLISSEQFEPAISLLDERERPRLMLYVTNGGGAAQFLGIDGPRIGLGETAAGGSLIAFDAQGQRRVDLGVMVYEPHRTQPRGPIAVYDEAGDVYFVVEDRQ